MANIRLTIQSGNTLYEPPIEEGVQIEWERSGTPGKLTFTTIKVEGLVFNEGDQVCFYCDDKLAFVGYVFSKSRDKEHRIKVTCYDQLRYLKNKYTYVFEKKTATHIVDALCKDFNLKMGKMDDTSYIIPAIIEENKAALDIILDVLEETLANTGKMYVLYDDCGKISIRNAENMMSTTLICNESAENFNYTSSIDDETYNSVVLYYDPNSNNSANASGEVGKILSVAQSQIGTVENPSGSNNIKYNTAYYGQSVSGSAYPWCCVFVWWVFNECGLSHLFYGGDKTASCRTAISWFKSQGQWVTSAYKPGDVIFLDLEEDGVASHTGIVESVVGDRITCIEGNTSNMVDRVVRTTNILGAGRPAYDSNSKTKSASSNVNTSTTSNSKNEPIQVFTAHSPEKINEWGLLRYFEKVDTPSIGQNKANALLKLYNRKTRELKVSGAFGDISVRGGTLIPVKLYLGDKTANNFMLVDKVVHKFDKDHHSMDLTLLGEWGDESNDIVSKTYTYTSPNDVTSSNGGSTGSGGVSMDTISTVGSTRVVRIKVLSSVVGGDIRVTYIQNGEQKTIEGQTSSFYVSADVNSLLTVTINTENNFKHTVEATTGGNWTPGTSIYNLVVKSNSSLSLRWSKINDGASSLKYLVTLSISGTDGLNTSSGLNGYTIQYYHNGVLTVANGTSTSRIISADSGSIVKVNVSLKTGYRASKAGSIGSWSGGLTSWQTTVFGNDTLRLNISKV